MDIVRESAMKALCAVERDGAYSNLALKSELAGKKDFSEQDRYFVTAIFYGVIDKKLTLDYAIEKYSKIKLKKLSVYILTILRMGIYQLLFMDKVPPSAAVNESVKLARRYGHSASAGYVNGVLRSVSRSGIEYPEGRNEYLSVKYSFPMWLTKMWINDFGYEFTENMMTAFSKSPKLTLRPNTLKVTAEELSEKLSKYGAQNDGVCVKCSGFDIEKNKLYKDGYFSVQDRAAMDAVFVLDPHGGENIIDMCAAPGGKTAHIAELMKNRGKITAFDLYTHKTELIKKNAKRLGIDIIDVLVRDAAVTDDSLIKTADRVLCDVPCTGLGIIGRKPEIKWNRAESFDELYKIQAAVLRNGAAYLKDGGTLVYSTCTINKAENEIQTAGFLEENPCFEKIYEKTYYPHIDNTDGFYICKMKRKDYA